MRAPDFWYDGGWQGVILHPLGLLYGLVSSRRMCRKPSGSVAMPVICIGNLTLGGAGKTPTVLYLARHLATAGHRPAILSRGYGGSLKGPLVVDPERHDAGAVGDEAALMARDWPVVIGADRVSAAQVAVSAGADFLIMDDGLQNPGLKRHGNLVVVDGEAGIGNGRIFPAGPLRAVLETQLALCDAMLVIGKGAEGDRLALQASKRGMPVFRGMLQPDEAAHRLAGLKVLAFCGIGRPEKFRRSLEAVGADIRGFVAFGDHHVLVKHEADALVERAAREGLALVTTPKDQARLAGDAYTRQALAGLVNVAGIDLVIEEAEAFSDWVTAVSQRKRTVNPSASPRHGP